MPKKPTDNPGFDAFWALYPRCLDKPGTKRAYDRAIKRGHTHAEIMTGLREYRFADQPHLIPHSMTWLNGNRFVAEIIRVPPTVVIEQPKPSRASWRDDFERTQYPPRSVQYWASTPGGSTVLRSLTIDGTATGPDLFHQTDNQARGK